MKLNLIVIHAQEDLENIKILGKTINEYVNDCISIIQEKFEVDESCIIHMRLSDEPLNKITKVTLDKISSKVNDDESILFLRNDMPFIKPETFIKLVENHANSNNDVVLSNEKILLKDCIIGCFSAKSLNKYDDLIMSAATIKVETFEAETFETETFETDEFFRFDSKLKFSNAISIAQKRINEILISEGVFILSPSSAYIDCTVKIGKNTMIYPNVIIEGNTVIGENCEIGPNSRLKNMELGDNISFQYSVAYDSKIGESTSVGPFAYIRPGSDIGSHVKVGDFVEVKNSKVGNNTKMSHLTYIGDSNIGENVNFGCGTITGNYDGKKKSCTFVDDNAFIGCNTNLIAPVSVGKGAYVAAGSTITGDVPDNSLAIARARQVNKNDWKDKKVED